MVCGRRQQGAQEWESRVLGEQEGMREGERGCGENEAHVKNRWRGG